MRRAALRVSIIMGSLIFAGDISLSAAEGSDPITYTARDYAFSGPDSIPAGWTTVQIRNQGGDLHQLQFIKLPPGKTAADFAAAITATHTRMPNWIERRGGPNSTVPGEHATATVHLEQGNYVVICGIPDRHGIPHAALGMIKGVTVTQHLSAFPPTPIPDSTITFMDFSFELSKPITAGRRTIQVVNKGTQAHEMVLVQLTRGATVRDFITDFRPGVPDLPAGKPIGGIVGLDPGGEAFFTVNFSLGDYGLICFLPDSIRGSPHFALGMVLDMAIN